MNNIDRSISLKILKALEVKAPHTSKSMGLSVLFLALLLPQAGNAQITPNDDGTGTTVDRDSQTFTIDGGRRSPDGSNLFHSFSEFGLDTDQIANFQSHPEILNILGRINGGNPSIINGLIQITGGSSNLFLMNPAGIVFGTDARLNVPGDFTATTATGIGFEKGWFNQIGDPNYSSLVGNPNAFSFEGLPRAIANFGILSVPEGQQLGLLGGSVLNLGTLSAPGGEITIASVPGQSRVRLSQPGHLLSLELDRPDLPGTDPTNLPQLLTGGGLHHANQITVNENGSIRLSGSTVDAPTREGTTLISGTVDASGTTGGQITILGTQIGTIASEIDASGSFGGGTVWIGGEYKGLGTLPNADLTFIDAGSQVRADAIASGSGGEAIVWSDRTTRIYGNISARGGATSGDGGFVETSSAGFLDVANPPDVSSPTGQGGTWLIDPYNITIAATTTFNIDTVIDPFTATGDNANLDVNDLIAALTDGATVIVSTGTGGTQDGNITLVNGTILDFDGTGNNTLRLEAANTITIDGAIEDSTPGGDLLNLFLIGDTDGDGEGQVIVNNTIATGGGDLTIEGDSLTGIGIQINGDLDSGGGAIDFLGEGSGTIQSQGIWIDAIVDSQGGAISMVGTSTSFEGLRIDGTILSGGGSINLTGIAITNPGLLATGSIDSEGGEINLTGTSDTFPGISTLGLIQSQNGNINMSATSSTAEDLSIADTVDAGTGNLTLTADEINLDPGFGTPELLGTGNLIIQPETPALNFQVGGAGDSALVYLTETEVDNIWGDFASITIGRADGSGTLTLGGDASFFSPVTLQVPVGTGTIATTGGTIFGRSIELLANQDITIATLWSPSGTIEITSNNGNIDGTQGSLDTSNEGDGGPIAVNAPNGAIDLGTVQTNALGGDGGSVTVIGDGDINIAEVAGTSINTTGTLNGNVEITSNNGAIAIDGRIFAGVANGDTGGNVSLQANNNISVLGDIISSGDLTASGFIEIISTNGSVSVTDVYADSESGTAGNITVTGLGDVTIGELFGSSEVGPGATVTLTSNEGAIAVGGAVPDVFFATFSNNGPGGDITIDAANGVTINETIDTTGTTGGGSVSVTSDNGAISTLEVKTTSTGGTGEAIALDAATTLTIAGGVDASNNSTIALTGDEIDLDGGLDTIRSTGGTLSLQPRDPNRNIELGGAANVAGSLSLTTTDLEAIADGFSSVTIGRNDSNGTLTAVSDVTLSDPTSIQAGAIDISGVTLTGEDDATIALEANNNLTTGNIANPGREVSLSSAEGTIDFSTATIDTRSTNGVGGEIVFDTANTLILGNIATNDRDLTFDMPIQLASDSAIAIEGAGGTITFNSFIDTTIIDTNQNLTLTAGTGDIIFNSDIGSGFPLQTLTANSSGVTRINANINAGGLQTDGAGSIELGATVATSGVTGQTYNEPVQLTDNAVLSSNNADITFNNSVDGSQNLTVTAGTGNVTFNSNLGNTTPLGQVQINSSGTTAIAGTVNATGVSTDAGGTTELSQNVTTTGATGQNYGDAVQLLGAIALTSQDADITFDSTVNGSQDLTVSAGTGDVSLNGDLGNGEPLGNLQVNSSGVTQLGNVQAASVETDAEGSTEISGNIITNGTTGQTYNDGVELTGNSSLNSNNQVITFSGTVDGNNGLTVDSGTAAVNFDRAIGNNIPVGNFTVNSGGTVRFGSTVTASSLTVSGAGSSELNGDVTTTGSAGQTYEGNVSLSGNIVLTGDELTFDGLVSGTGRVQLQPFTSSQPIAIGGTQQTSGLDLTATDLVALQDGFSEIVIGRGDGSGAIAIAPNGATFSDPVVLQSPFGAIAVNGILQGTGDATLTLSAPNIALNADLLSNNQNITLGGENSAITLGNNLLISTGTGLGDIRLLGQLQGARDLTLDSGIGNIFVLGFLGNSPLGILRANSSGVTEFAGNLQALGILTDTDGTTELSGTVTTTGGEGQVYNDPVSLIGETRLESNGADIEFGDRLDGNADLTLNAGLGNILFAGEVGATEALGILTIESANNVDALGAIAASSFIQEQGTSTTTLNALTTTGTVDLNVDGAIAIDRIVSNGGDVGLTSNRDAVTVLGEIDTRTTEAGTPGGAVSVLAATEIVTGDILTSANSASSGGVSLSASGNITTGNIDTRSAIGDGGPITLNSTGNNGSLLTGDLLSSANSGDGGPVSLTAPIDITTGNIDTSSVDGDAGSVKVDPETINIASIRAESVSGRGGEIDVVASESIRITDSFTAQDGTVSSISSQGGAGSGAIALQHGGDENMLFTVGDPTLNGTAGAITAGFGPEDTILPTFAIPFPPQTFTQGNITVRTTAPEPPVIEPVEDPIVPPGTPTELEPAGEITSPESPTVEEVAAQFGEPTIAEPQSPEAPQPGVSETEAPQAAPEDAVVEETATDTEAATDNVTDSVNEAIAPPIAIDPAEVESAEAIDSVDIDTENPTLSESATGSEPSNSFPQEGEVSAALQGETLEEEEIPAEDMEYRNVTEDVSRVEVDPGMEEIDRAYTQEVAQYFSQQGETSSSSGEVVSLSEARNILHRVEEATGVKPALIYVNFVPSYSGADADSDELDLVLVTTDGKAVRSRVGVTRGEVMEQARQFQGEITNARKRNTDSYLQASRQLYDWIIAPLQTDLEAREIDNLVFIMDTGLRSLPMAALHDGEGFVIERYSVGLMPSLSLTDTRYGTVKGTQVLAMGASEFSELSDLPAVPTEIRAIATELWSGQYYLNEQFTLENLKKKREQGRYGAIHLSTHGQFLSGEPGNSYIQLWDTKLGLDQLRELGWNDPPVELLVLSACRTALGDEQAELGFAGLAFQAGVKTAVASLWYVSDEGTLSLMTEFYRQLDRAPIKAEALRRAQLAMLRGEVRIENGRLVGTGESGQLPLPEEIANRGDRTLSHPYYWSAFTTIGNPW
ncbi:CHAT domain-containing protein [Oxynema sp. CENA135]|uniref:CHAT domain-containing protein n=1 Tax=Oxynema sp. CENA135 TaxID=984206 RepID=UPI00190C419F|nr:CHAT domain-containing protein [Oxynema sp. CENA135]MBK4729341.1 CHAT domain-containing protein [Oxynema sp. CENA135]